MELKIATSAQVLQWTLDDPKSGNALGPGMASLLLRALEDLEGHCTEWLAKGPSAKLAWRVLVVSAVPAGRRNPVWIAGGHLKELARLSDHVEARRYAETMSQVCARLSRLPIPVIMAMHGEAIGGGAEFALAGDVRLATVGSSLDFRQLKIGLTVGYGTTHRLCQLLGLSRARQLLLGHQRLAAQAAHTLGLIDYVVGNAEELKQRTHEIAADFCRIEPLALAAQKEMLVAATTLPAAEAAERELSIFSRLWMNPSHRAFLQPYTEPSRQS